MEKRSSSDTDVYMGPYRATKLWNDVIYTFRNGMPCGKHRRYMRTYEDCFVASCAVEWVHNYMKNNPNFGQEVTRVQTVQLLQKIYKAGVFEDVRGPKHGRADFAENGRIYRFTSSTSPKTTNSSSSRTPLSTRKNIVNCDTPDTTDGCKQIDDDELRSCHLVAKILTPGEIEDVWKTFTLSRLQLTIGVDNLTDIMDSQLVNGHNIMHNCIYINKSGLVSNVQPKDQLPPWAMSAMKCLARWPEKVEENLPNYPGFEKDVFGVVKDYFTNLEEPLMTYDMYEVITNVFGESLSAEDCAKKALQLVCLLLPPANRRKLQLLLKLMYKMTINQDLNLDPSQSTRSLVLETFYKCILSCPDENEMDHVLVIQLVSFLMDHHTEVFSVPTELKLSVEDRLTTLQKPQIKYSPDDPLSLRYCRQVAVSTFESDKQSNSQKALTILLEEIINDTNMADKDKKKRLKMFQKTYPEIYTKRFPTAESAAEVFPAKLKIKQPLLVKPFMKLRGLRM
ncbi:DEP domain-containing protein 1A isoform X5 [Patella vulgata]|uniref:DEP domain-containing protein 1A isoform X5 n=1 Tax=Patella vulgata TaxID=6465 RepID=UPI0024A7CE2F|nr:DEP domain-containing protein 1A isoform X5 [Patella vulgata]